jgi:hypothetical protein
MNNELLILRGRLATAEQLIPTITSGIDVDIDELRTMLDKYVPKTELQIERIKVVSDRIGETVKRLRELTNLVASIKRDLGE